MNRPLLSRKNIRSRSRARRGSFTMLAAGALFAMVALAGLSINIAYLELSRTEQRLATDAATKAALVTLGQSQSRSSAIAAAKSIAALHSVAGRSVVLTDSDILIGTSTGQNNGSYSFAQDNSSSPSVLNSVKVSSNLSNLSGGGVPIIAMPTLMGSNTFTATQSATSTRIDMDVCLVIDRSGSMAWDLGSTPFSYPGALQGKSSIQNYFQLPHPTLSRWASLKSAIGTFSTVISASPLQTRVSMASYSSNFTFGVWSSVVASTDLPLTTNYSSLTTTVDRLATQPLIGNTNIAAGLRQGIGILTDPSTSRVTSSKTLILLTDGVLSQGDDPVALAASARSMNIRIHTIAFSAQADANLMQQVAAAGGGQCYVAPTSAALDSAFRSIAVTLPNMLTN